MSAAPFMQLYVGDYLGDTQHFTTEQHGAYLLILMTMWRAGGELPDDDAKLARIARLSTARWVKIKAEIVELLDVADGKVTQKRLRAELEKAREKSQKRSEAGRAGGNAKSLKSGNQAVAIATILPEHLPEPEPEPESKNKQIVPAPSGQGAAKRKRSIPDGFPHEAAIHAAAKYWSEKGRPDLAARATDEGLQFRDHHLARNSKMLDWDAAWRTWVRNAMTFNKPAKGDLFSAPVVFKQTNEAGWLIRLEEFYLGAPQDEVEPGYWQDKFGPKPGMPGCAVPEAAFRMYEKKHGPLKNRRLG